MQAGDGRVQLIDAAAGKIAARGAQVGCKQRIADEHVVADAIAQAVGGVSGRRHHLDRQRAGAEQFAVGEQPIERVRQRRVGAIHREHGREVILHRGDAAADGDGHVQPGAQERGRAQVVGVGMGFQDEMHAQIVGGNEVEHLARRPGADPARAVVVVEYRINHHRITARMDDVGPGAGQHMEKGLHLWGGRHRLSPFGAGCTAQKIRCRVSMTCRAGPSLSE